MHQISTKAISILVVTGLVIVGVTFLSFYKAHQKNTCKGDEQKLSTTCASRDSCPGLIGGTQDCQVLREAK